MKVMVQIISLFSEVIRLYLINVGLQQEVSFAISSIKVPNFIKTLQHIVTGLIGFQVILNFIYYTGTKENKKNIRKDYEKFFDKKFRNIEINIQTLKKNVKTQFQFLKESIKSFNEKFEKKIQLLEEVIEKTIQLLEEEIEKKN
jgi:hypothetical protein